MILVQMVLLIVFTTAVLACQVCVAGTMLPGGVKTDPEMRPFWLYDRAQRVNGVRRFDSILQTNYGALVFKQAFLSLDTGKIISEAIAVEEGIDNPIAENPSANLEFIDRMIRLAAKFKDAHLRVQAVVKPPKISLPILTKMTGGRLYVINIDRSRFKDERLQVGDELTYIDGSPSYKAIEDLVPYISASSDAAALERATEAFASRNFRYPASPTIKVKAISRAKSKEFEVSLRYDAYDRKQPVRIDSKIFLESHGYRFIIASDPRPIVELPRGSSDVQVYLGTKEAKDDPQLATAYFSYDGTKVGVLRLLSFEDEDLADNAKRQVLYDEIVGDFVARMKREKLGLIVDLRGNRGGIGKLPGKILSHLAKSGAVYEPVTETFAMLPVNQQLLEQYSQDGEMVNLGYLAAFRTAFAQKRSTAGPTPISSVIRPSKSVGGYDFPVIALVDPGCGSSCDRMALLFKDSGRAKLLGTQAHGMGGGFKTRSPMDQTRWRDDNQIISIDVPNLLWGIRDRQTVENQPVISDVVVEPSVDDLIGHGIDYYRAAVRLIRASK